MRQERLTDETKGLITEFVLVEMMRWIAWTVGFGESTGRRTDEGGGNEIAKGNLELDGGNLANGTGKSESGVWAHCGTRLVGKLVERGTVQHVERQRETQTGTRVTLVVTVEYWRIWLALCEVCSHVKLSAEVENIPTVFFRPRPSPITTSQHPSQTTKMTQRIRKSLGARTRDDRASRDGYQEGMGGRRGRIRQGFASEQTLDTNKENMFIGWEQGAGTAQDDRYHYLDIQHDYGLTRGLAQLGCRRAERVYLRRVGQGCEGRSTPQVTGRDSGSTIESRRWMKRQGGEAGGSWNVRLDVIYTMYNVIMGHPEMRKTIFTATLLASPTATNCHTPFSAFRCTTKMRDRTQHRRSADRNGWQGYGN
ncbi:hypothetical protein L210DRAFT_3729050 [Boletus edulis BED1]|uniref:Uncharacterized protein n=1 Tax=Boletus edulis BED1 TaxID=1328754 RepID=A0AAD4BI11_BOLED|nr:hypothetical protein L210DRAFT_3729050 [Boletus edulis BED1]